MGIHERIERNLENAIPLAQLRAQISVIFETLINRNKPEETNHLIENARQAFCTHVLGPQLYRLVDDVHEMIVY